jgi:hypothetical protein
MVWKFGKFNDNNNEMYSVTNDKMIIAMKMVV